MDFTQIYIFIVNVFSDPLMCLRLRYSIVQSSFITASICPQDVQDLPITPYNIVFPSFEVYIHGPDNKQCINIVDEV